MHTEEGMKREPNGWTTSICSIRIEFPHRKCKVSNYSVPGADEIMNVKGLWKVS